MSAERPRRRSRALAGDDRAQTVLDFVVGMSVFLLVVGFTFAFVPSLLEPYIVGEGSTVIVAERGTAQLVESSLAGPGSTATLSGVCTHAFFNGTDAETAASELGCNWESNADALHAELGVDEDRGLNVTVTRNGTLGKLGDDEVPMRGGDAPPRSQSVSAASRIVDIDGETYRLTLRVW